MPICEICGMEVIEVFDCSRCDAKFCKECGNIKDKLCYDCLGWNSEQLEVDREDEGGADSWADDEPH
ncbi:hypothetical protein E3J20_02600 [Candidatus Bathyarchaeota archaeon]|nr:MAG: hypothetical protein E3J20_02600 [Candidatus Bathyarchaeota archaeon]